MHLLAHLLTHTDEYCERLGPGLMAEPLNAFSNGAIFISGLMALWLYHDRFPLHGSRHRPSVLLLIALVLITAIGSFLYHTYAEMWAMYADVIPILVFIYVYHAVFLRRILAFRNPYIVCYVAVFFLVSFLLGKAYGTGALNGSVAYLPALGSFFVVWLFMYLEERPGTRLFGASAVIFSVSVFFRSIDMTICPSFHWGSHYMWHTLNAIVLYCLLKLVIQLPNFYKRQQRDAATAEAQAALAD